MIAKRLDHLHIGVHSLADWVPVFRDLLGLRVIRGISDPSEAKAEMRDMLVSEYQIGDGFIALLAPAGEDGQIAQFLKRKGEGFYALSFDAGNLPEAGRILKERGIPYIDTQKVDFFDPGNAGFIWLSPSLTKGVAVQLTWQWTMEQGANPNLLGLSSAVVAAADIEAVLPAYEQILDLREVERVRNERFGYEAAVMAIGDSADRLVVASSTDAAGRLAKHMAEKGASIFQFTITAKDLGAEVARLRAAGAGVEVDDEKRPALAWIDPKVTRGVRIELAQAR